MTSAISQCWKIFSLIFVFVILISFFSVILFSPATSLSHTLDMEGSGYLWTASDIGNNHDRAGGTGNWMYGSMADTDSLISLYKFSGLGGFYTAKNSGNISQNIQATDLKDFNASVSMSNESVALSLNGTGRIKMVIGTSNEKGQPKDLSRTYINGTFAIENKHNVGAW